MADAQSKAEKLAAARKKAEEMKKKKAKKQKAAPAAKEEESAAEPSEEKSKEAEAEDEEETPAEVEPSTPAGAGAEPATIASPFAFTDTESTTHAGDAGAASESTAELEVKLAELEKELADAKAARDEAQLTADALEKKVVSLELLHQEDEAHINRLQTDVTGLKDENVDLKNRIQKAEAENLRLSKKEAQDGGGTDNDRLDELEDEERQRLETRIRELEAENTDLRRGIWHEKRRDMQGPMDEAGGQFDNVPLEGPSSLSMARKQGGFGEFFTHGLNALTGGGGGHEHHHDNDDGFLDDDEEFDEEAFRKAQEEAARARIERIKEVKRGLKNWESWRLDLVEGRRGGGEGIGEMFEV